MSETFKDLLASGELSGYENYAPGDDSMDAEIIAKTVCPECGGAMKFEPYTSGHRPNVVSYRAFAVCLKCDHVYEF